MAEHKFVYFIFSASQYRMRLSTEKKIGREYHPGTVLVNGVYKQFTDIIETLDNRRYPDGVVVASGYLDQMKYKRR